MLEQDLTSGIYLKILNKTKERKEKTWL